MTLTIDAIRLPLAHFGLDVTCTFGDGVTALFGPSGAGKTSLLDVIAGLRRTTHGRVYVDHDDITELAPRHRRIGYVPQENALFPHLSVERNLRFGMRANDFAHVVSVLDIAPLLGRAPGSLSGGEQKRVALGRALLTAPRLLLLDEPLAGLDRPLRERVLTYLVRVRDEFRVPMVYVSHDADELRAIADRVVVLERGRVVREGAM